MRRLGLVLTVSAVGLALVPSPARAQSEGPSFGCIPTSDTPIQTEFVGVEAAYLLLADPDAALPRPVLRTSSRWQPSNQTGPPRFR